MDRLFGGLVMRLERMKQRGDARLEAVCEAVAAVNEDLVEGHGFLWGPLGLEASVGIGEVEQAGEAIREFVLDERLVERCYLRGEGCSVAAFMLVHR